ncbi:acetyl-CoA carboxylase biotin carboxyl carrier protein [Clostridium chrysemydis]|uniref:acetyl-CoA carboxylase biotin carboxyl carrier protein n=1 Tax=Clostridium chrysemydis TaxID=2665504 RepID=UPI003F34DF6B
MNINEVKELINLINDSDLAYFELNNSEISLKMDKSMDRSESFKEVKNLDLPLVKTNDKVLNEVKEVKANDSTPKEEKGGKIITSPMVGTFYAKASPDSDPFVTLGDNVNKGDVICIIEAMKLMNEIESESNGKITEVLIKDGDMVEFGTPLFRIEEV